MGVLNWLKPGAQQLGEMEVESQVRPRVPPYDAFAYAKSSRFPAGPVPCPQNQPKHAVSWPEMLHGSAPWWRCVLCTDLRRKTQCK